MKPTLGINKKQRSDRDIPFEPGVVRLADNGPQILAGPQGQSDPQDNELRWCAWGVLLAAKAQRDGVAYSMDYLTALAEMYRLPMPVMAPSLDPFLDEDLYEERV